MIGADVPESLAREGRPFIGAFWHQRMLMLPPIWRNRRKLHMLISSHRDGILISRVVGYFGIPTIVGSTNRGAADALRGMLAVLRKGEIVAVTPDGPRGPARKAARKTGSIRASVQFLARAGEIKPSISGLRDHAPSTSALKKSGSATAQSGPPRPGFKR
jgi:lysophospholipid acyltransferase (LPLAT)-like uncharacterized protein